LLAGLAKTTELRSEVIKVLRHSSPREADRLDEAVAAMPRCGERVFGFELVRELGEGAFAKVFYALQLELADRPVALKVALSLSDEPRKLARLQHTNIVPIYSTHHSDSLHAVCMPFLGSLTLDHLLKSMSVQTRSFPKSGRELLSTLFDRPSATVADRPETQSREQPPLMTTEAIAATPIYDMMCRFSHIEAVLWMGARIADGLSHAHDRAILHLDLKPANILLTDDGQPMLLDFNLSVDLSDVGSLDLARLGGTLPFMSPEQLEAFGGGKRDLDARSDLFSLGVILFEMLTGVAPYQRRPGQMKEMIAALLADRRQSPPSARQFNPAISPAVDAIVQKLLEPDRTRRYQSAAQLREDFERQLAHLPLKYARDRSIPERARKWRRRNPRSAVAVVVALLASAFLMMPATVLAVRQNQIAERQRQIETAEAKQQWMEAARESRVVQVLLATRSGERAKLDEGIARGKAVLDQYRVEANPDWLMQPLVARLTAQEQKSLRKEFGEMLLFMTRGEWIRLSDTADSAVRERTLQAALHWNLLAFHCYPTAEVPRLLIEQRNELVKKLPHIEENLLLPEPPAGALVEFDAYHEGVSLAMAGSYRDALRLLLPFTERHPRHYQSWFVRGICHENLGEYAEASSCWTVCIALDPDLSHAYFNRGLVRLKEADYARANRDFSHALELKPDWTDALLDRSIARKGMKDYRGAIADLDRVIATPGTTVRARFLRAEIKELNGQVDEAKLDLAAALKIQPDDELGWSTRGYVRMETEPTAALQDFEQALKLNPRSREALINKSIVLSEYLKRPREAVVVFDRFLEYYPDHVAARLGRGVILARLGECERARRDAEESLERDRSPFFLFQAAGLYAQIAQYEKGDDAKKEALALLGSALRKGFADLELFKTDADLNPIRGEAEFKRLLEIATGLK
jgi:serine/threonine protein kinase/Tfp pilus assembly protein PilF